MLDGYKEMTVADFNERISEILNENEDAYLDAMESVEGRISESDKNASFILNTFALYSEEFACKHWQSFDVYFRSSLECVNTEYLFHVVLYNQRQELLVLIRINTNNYRKKETTML